MDEHYGRPRSGVLARSVTPRTAAGLAFCALVPAAERWLRLAAASAGTPCWDETRRARRAAQVAHGGASPVAALDGPSPTDAGGRRHPLDPGRRDRRPTAHRSRRRLGHRAARDSLRVRPRPRSKTVGRRPRAAATRTASSTEVEHGLRRLKLASMRRAAPEMLLTARRNAGRRRSCFERSSRSRSPPATPATPRSAECPWLWADPVTTKDSDKPAEPAVHLRSSTGSPRYRQNIK